MIDKYLYTIGRYLSPKSKDEILKEIEVNLYDALEEQYGEGQPTEDQIETVIRQLGHPKKVAESYMDSPRSLIGPTLIDTYFEMLKIFLVLTVVGVAIGQTLANPESIVMWFVGVLSGLLQGALTTIGMVTLIFAMIQYFNHNEEVDEEEEWSLEILEEKPHEKSQVSKGETIAESVFLMILLLFINTDIVSRLISLPNVSGIVPVMDPNVWAVIIWPINAFIILSIGFNIYLIARGHYRKNTRILSIALDIITLAVISWMFFYPGLWNMDAAGNVIDAETTTILSNIMRLIYGIIVVVTGVDIIGHVRSLLRI